MPTLKAIRQRILKIDSSLGRVEAITALATGSVTAAALAVGTVGAGKFSTKWLLRPEAALNGSGVPVDRLRLSTASGYTASTGLIAHAGANYTDTTITGESLEIHEHEPYLLDNAICAALRGTRFLDYSTIPTQQNDRYSLESLSWIVEPSDIVKVEKYNIPVLNNNRGFEKWNTYSAGSLRPDGFTLAGSSATFARSSTSRTGAYSLSVTRAGTDATVSFTIPVLDTGVSEDSIRGEKVTAVCVGRSGQANSLIVTIDSQKSDGTSILSEDSSAHTGGGSWEELTKEHTVSATADQVVITATVNVDETALIDELYVCLGTLDDNTRRNGLRNGHRVRGYKFEQGQPPVLYVSAGGRGAVLLVQSQRPYEQFTQSRIDAGTADADETDAPLDLIAYGALYRLFEDLPENPDQARKTFKYERIYRELQSQHLSSDDTDESRGADFIPPPRNGNSIARIR
jgi:hypothetical protein